MQRPSSFSYLLPFPEFSSWPTQAALQRGTCCYAAVLVVLPLPPGRTTRAASLSLTLLSRLASLPILTGGRYRCAPYFAPAHFIVPHLFCARQNLSIRPSRPMHSAQGRSVRSIAFCSPKVFSFCPAAALILNKK
jgi:hypothetical protein